MMQITVECPSGRRKLTITDPPFPALGDEIEGYGTVIKAKHTKGFNIPLAAAQSADPAHVDKSTPEGSPDPREAKTKDFTSIEFKFIENAREIDEHLSRHPGRRP